MIVWCVRRCSIIGDVYTPSLRGGLLVEWAECSSACIETKLDEAISRKLQIVSPWRHATLRSTPSSSGFALRSGRDALTMTRKFRKPYDRIFTTLFFHGRGAGTFIGSRPRGVIHHSSQRTSGTGGRVGLGAGDRDGKLHPGCCRDAWDSPRSCYRRRWPSTW